MRYQNVDTGEVRTLTTREAEDRFFDNRCPNKWRAMAHAKNFLNDEEINKAMEGMPRPRQQPPRLDPLSAFLFATMGVGIVIGGYYALPASIRAAAGFIRWGGEIVKGLM